MSLVRASPRLAVPSALNLVLTAGVAGGLVALLLAGPGSGWPGMLAVIGFALLFQTNFALFHEAGHGKLHPIPAWNRRLGVIVGTVFGMSFSMFALTHGSHHRKNRTDQEMFDLYYPHQRRWRRAVLWYGMLLGVWFWVIPPFNLLVLLAPRAAARLARRMRIADVVFASGPATLRRIRVELALWLALLATAAAVGGAGRVLAFYLPATWLWSTVQYLEHAYAPRDVVAGAFNLRAPAWLSWLNLHRELDLEHHLRPDAPWIHLPALARSRPDGAPHPRYFRHYLAQWRGPRLTLAPGPAPLSDPADLARG